MLRNESNIPKLIAALGVLGLMMCLCAPRADAQLTSFSAANYSGRYVCSVASDGDFFTAVVKINPNGAGGYTAVGTLTANGAAFVGGSPAAVCVYNLSNSTSGYTINVQGLGFEKLVWTASSSNAATCPAAFIDNTAISLRNLVNNNKVVIDAEFTDDNLLGQGFAGHGFCLK